MLHGLNSCGEGKVLSYKKGSLKFFLYHSFSSLSLSLLLPSSPGQLERVHDERPGRPDLEGVEKPQPQAPGRPGAGVDKRRRDLVPGDAQRRGDDIVDGQRAKGERDRVGRVEPDAERDERPDGGWACRRSRGRRGAGR